MNRPKFLYTLGDYYATKSLRELCHRIKTDRSLRDEDFDFYTKTALLGKHIVAFSNGPATLVPIPSGNPNIDVMADWLSEITGYPVCRCIGKEPDAPRLYDLKKEGKAVTEKDAKLILTSAAPSGRIILVDNVIATGTTCSAAISLIGKPCNAACLAVDYNKYLNK